MGSSPALDQKFFVLVFFDFVTFFRKFFKCLQGAPLFFSILQKNGCSKTSKEPCFTFFGHYATYRRLRKFQKKLKNWIFFHFFSHASTVEENT